MARIDLIVGFFGFSTITEALSAASKTLQTSSSEITIQVMAGTYRESLMIDNNVIITGVGKRKNVVIIGSEKSAISSTAKNACIKNLTLRQEGEKPCVDILSGELLIEYCNIRGGKSCIAIHGEESMPILRNNQIHDGKENGISIFDRGKGTIEHNEIFRNKYGISVAFGGDPIVRNNKIYKNRNSGIFIFEHGKGTIEQNESFQNAFHGISVKSGADPAVFNNMHKRA